MNSYIIKINVKSSLWNLHDSFRNNQWNTSYKHDLLNLFCDRILENQPFGLHMVFRFKKQQLNLKFY